MVIAAVLCLILLAAIVSAIAAQAQDRARDAVVAPVHEYAQPLEPVLTDINTASLEELTALPGIGETIAERIIARRDASGPFASAEELLSVEGIGEAKLEVIRDKITCNP